MTQKPHKGIYILPNLITTGNMFCGFLSIIHSFHSDHAKAAWFLIFAAVFDMLDGRVARMAKATSVFGVEYDSLSDLVSFGVAPALIAYQWSLESFGRLGWAVSFLFLVCAALRLARFNVSTHIAPKGYFQGLPTPISCGVVATWILFLDYTGFFEDTRSFITLGMFVLLPFLMVSMVPFPSFKEVNWRSRASAGYFLVAIVSAVLVLIRPEITMFALMAGYVVINPLIALFKMTKVKKIIPAVFLLMALGAQAEESVQPFIDEVKAKQDPAAVAKDAESEGYTDRIKATLEPETDESVIQKVKEGRSELKIKKRGKIHGEAGFKLGMGFDRDIKPAAGRFNWNSYEKTFGKGWDPDVQLYFGWQPLHHEYIGSLGIFLSTGFSTNAGTWYPPGVTEEYKIRFTTIPATVGAMYRFNLPYYIRPYVQFGPTMLWYSETRGDSDAKGNKGFTKGTTMNIGASILLDWISSDVEEGLYDDYGIHHQYLTVESSQMKTTGDGIDINANVLYVGFMFEY